MKQLICRMYKKLNNTRAFTIGEALVATLIMLLVTVIMVTGIPAAGRAYDNVVTASNAEVLLSTSMTVLRNELSTANDINIGSDGSIEFYNESVGYTSKIYKSSGGDEPDGTIMYQRYYSAPEIGSMAPSDNSAKRLVSKEASGGNLFVTYNGVSHNNGVITFDDLAVMKDTDSGAKETPAKRDYSIRVISE